MAPLLPQDRPWNQSEGTNRQPFFVNDNLKFKSHAQTPMDSNKSEFAQISVHITIHTDICQTSVSIGKVDQIGKI